MRTSAVQRLFGPSDESDKTRGTETLRALARERLTELEEDLSELKHFHNSLVPAAVLPPEILCRIFDIHRNQHRKGITRFEPKGSTGWIGITHVCRRWRDVAVDFPSLWSDISFRYPPFTEIMLQRSKEVPLRIAHNFQENAPQALQAVFCKALSRPERLLTVDVDARTKGPMRFSAIAEFFRKSTPHLQDLSLTTSSESPDSFPDDFLGEYAPSRGDTLSVDWILSNARSSSKRIGQDQGWGSNPGRRLGRVHGF